MKDVNIFKRFIFKPRNRMQTLKNGIPSFPGTYRIKKIKKKIKQKLKKF